MHEDTALGDSMKPLLRGTGASAGVVQGRVRIVTEPSHATRMKDGEVLVAEFTTPLFMPAILKASAVVTDLGGMLAHAAIVAREFGIPCVVGTQNATKVLRDGQEVIVDGSEGIVCGWPTR
jgi:pyruvate,water dikinase